MKKLAALSKASQHLSNQAPYQDPYVVQRQLRRQTKQLQQQVGKENRRMKLLTWAYALGAGLRGTRMPSRLGRHL